MRAKFLPTAVIGLAAALLAFLSVSPGFSANGGNDYNLGFQQGAQDGASATAQGAAVQTQGTAPNTSSDEEESSGGCS